MLLGLTVFFTSAAALALEVLLMRLLSITQWHHFAYLIISLAMLGYGAAGTFTTIALERFRHRSQSLLVGNGLLFSMALVLTFATVQRIPLNPLEILWDGKQTLYLVQVYLVLSLPFLFAANCIILVVVRLKDRIHQVYLLDLLGAGTGASGIILLLTVLSPQSCLRVLSAFGFFAAASAVLNERSRKSFFLAAILFGSGCLLPFAWPDAWLEPRISEYKGLSMALRVPGARVIEERFSPLSYLAVVESPTIPFRHAPGMSLNCSLGPPPQLGVFTDGDAMSPITRHDGRMESLAWLDCLTSALPYHLLQRPKVLILGAGGGMDVLMAEYHRAGSVDAVELDQRTVDLVRRTFGEYAGRIFDRQTVRVHVAEARGFVARATGLYDLIQLSLLDSFSTSLTGASALNETYLYTIEGFQEYLRHLKPGGLLSITRWIKFPPRESLKLFATAAAAMEASGLGKPENCLALIRSWDTTTLLVKNGAFSSRQTEQIRTFCETRSFDVDYSPGLPRSAANRYNIAEEPYIYDGARALLGDQREDFIRDYKFNIAPATDDRPYFFHFIKWRSIPEILSLKRQGGLSLMEWTFPTVVLTLLQAFLASLVWVLLPLRFLGPMPGSRSLQSRICVYFVCLGLAFMFVEIAFIQKFILFLSHPVYAVAVVLSAFLVFAGLGSSLSKRLGRLTEKWCPSRPGLPVGVCVLGIILISVLYAWGLPSIFKYFMFLEDPGRVLLSLLLIGPPALLMGMPFPLGLAQVAETAEDLIPWSWGVNGCASVTGAVLAAILAVHLGFQMVITLALILYASALAAFWKPLGEQGPRFSDP